MRTEKQRHGITRILPSSNSPQRKNLRLPKHKNTQKNKNSEARLSVRKENLGVTFHLLFHHADADFDLLRHRHHCDRFSFQLRFLQSNGANVRNCEQNGVVVVTESPRIPRERECARENRGGNGGNYLSVSED